jgi:hypothetical protein
VVVWLATVQLCERKGGARDGPGTGAGAASVEARRVVKMSAREEMRRMVKVEMR